MKTFFTIGRNLGDGTSEYLQENGMFSKSLDYVQLYEFEREVPPLEDGEFITKIFQAETENLFE